MLPQSAAGGTVGGSGQREEQGEDQGSRRAQLPPRDEVNHDRGDGQQQRSDFHLDERMREVEVAVQECLDHRARGVNPREHGLKQPNAFDRADDQRRGQHRAADGEVAVPVPVAEFRRAGARAAIGGHAFQRIVIVIAYRTGVFVEIGIAVTKHAHGDVHGPAGIEGRVHRAQAGEQKHSGKQQRGSAVGGGVQAP